VHKKDYWVDFPDELLMGKYSRPGEEFATFLETIIDLSKGYRQKKDTISH
jgi:hypothetical protein